MKESEKIVCLVMFLKKQFILLFFFSQPSLLS